MNSSIENIDYSKTQEIYSILRQHEPILHEISDLSQQYLEETIESAFTIKSYYKVIEYQINNDATENPLQYKDINAFYASDTSSNMIFEFQLLNKFDSFIALGKVFINWIYTYRSLSKVFDNISLENKNVDKVNEKICEIMQPYIVKLNELASFINDAILLIVNTIQQIISKRQLKFDKVLLTLKINIIKLINTLTTLNHMIALKSSIGRDVLRYKGVLGSDRQKHYLHELLQLTNLFPNSRLNEVYDYIIKSLKQELRGVLNYEMFLLDLLEICYEQHEKQFYLCLEDKYMYIKMITHLMILIDSRNTKGMNFFKVYKLKGKIQKLFKQYPIMPLIGDMILFMPNVITLCENFHLENSENWKFSFVDIKDVGYDATSLFQSTKESLVSFHLKYGLLKQKLSFQKFEKALHKINLDIANEVSSLTNESLHLLLQISNILRLSYCWKLAHPIDIDDTLNISKTISTTLNEPYRLQLSNNLYARSILYNLPQDEKLVQIEYISMIKSIASSMLSIEHNFAFILRFAMHHQIQSLIQKDLIPMTHRIDKRKNNELLSIVLQMRSVCCDWLDGLEPKDDYQSYSSTQQHLYQTPRKHPARVVSLSNTQLIILRELVRYLLFYEVHSSKLSLFSKANITKEDVVILDQFYSQSFAFPYYLNLSESIHHISNLSYLYFREFHLDLTNSIQFPIDMSIPWIYLDFILSEQNLNHISLIDNVLYVLDVYNDVAYDILHVYQSQLLYNELEAEVSLVFDQIIFLLAKDIFHYYKEQALSKHLDKVYTMQLEDLKATGIGLSKEEQLKYENSKSEVHQKRSLTSLTRNYSQLLKQKQFHLLDKNIHFIYLIQQQLVKLFHKDIKLVFEYFESDSICNIIEIITMLNILNDMHKLLSNECDMTFIPFDMMFHQLNSISENSKLNRLDLGMTRSLISDLFPHYSYNYYTQRYIPSTTLNPINYGIYKDPPKPNKLRKFYGNLFYKAFDNWFKLSRQYFGRLHIEYILSNQYISIINIIDEVMKDMTKKLYDINQFINIINGMMSKDITYVSYSLHGIGAYQSYQVLFSNIYEYDELIPRLIQPLRGIGNSLLFLFQLSQSIDMKNAFEFNSLSSVLGITPLMGSSISDIDELITLQESPVSYVLDSISRLQVDEVANENMETSLIVTTKSLVDNIIQDSNQLLKSLTLSCTNHKSLFHYVLERLQEYLLQMGVYEILGVRSNVFISSSLADLYSSSMLNKLSSLDINSMAGFFKVFSVLSFIFSYPLPVASKILAGIDEHDLITNEELFGHGFLFSGCMLLFLLKQQHLYEFYDITSHVLNIFHSQHLDTQDNNSAIDKRRKEYNHCSAHEIEEFHDFIECSLSQRELQNDIFQLLNGLFKQGLPYDNVMNSARNNFHFEPKKHCNLNNFEVFHPVEE